MAQTIAVIDESELKDGQMKEVAFGEGKVLVAKLGDKVHATSAFCTHYGAPLAKGTLTSDGRVVCPWHGACFNVCTGDIEDAPALNAIHSFQTKVQDGKIHVTADPKYTKKDDNLARAPTVTQQSSTQGEKGVVIVGGGSGAIHAIESLRENGYKKSIIVVSSETYPPIDRTKLSKAEIKDPAKVVWRSEEELKTKYGVDLRLGKSVTSVDTTSKEVTIDDMENLSYETLILATGGVPRRLPIPNADLSNVFTLRHVQDAQKIYDSCVEGSRVGVIGSSFISMEIVANITKKKMKTIDVIGMESVPFERILGKEIGEGLMQYHQKNGVRFHMNSGVEAIIPSESDPSKAGSIKLKDSQAFDVDVVIMGVGVAPATEFLKKSGFALEKDGGVKVDEYLKVPGKEDVYAIGDIAVFPQTEQPEARRIEHWNVAGNHGRAVGRTIAGRGLPFEKVPVFWSAQGQQLRYAGLGHDYDDIIIKGSPSALKFVAYYTKGDKVVAVASMQNDPVVVRCSELMRLGKMPTATEVRNGIDPLHLAYSWVRGQPAQDPMKIDLASTSQ